MKHLVYLIQEAFPERIFSIKEVYETDEVYNVYVEYQLYIQDNYSEHFKSFSELEKFVYKIHAEEAFHDARRIIEGKKRNQE